MVEPFLGGMNVASAICASLVSSLFQFSGGMFPTSTLHVGTGNLWTLTLSSREECLEFDFICLMLFFFFLGVTIFFHCLGIGGGHDVVDGHPYIC